MDALQFKPAVLSKRLEQALLRADWDKRDVLVGCLRDRHQLRVCLRHRFYHMPADRLEGDPQNVRWVAIYQSQTLFGARGGVRYFGRVTACETVARRDIIQIPRDSDTLYYRFSVSAWKSLPKKITSKELPFTHLRTTEFLLRHGTEIPELVLEDERQFRLYRALKKLLGRPKARNSRAGFRFEDAAVTLVKGEVCTLRAGKLQPSYLLENYADFPYTVFRHILSQLTGSQ